MRRLRGPGWSPCLDSEVWQWWHRGAGDYRLCLCRKLHRPHEPWQLERCNLEIHFFHPNLVALFPTLGVHHILKMPPVALALAENWGFWSCHVLSQKRFSAGYLQVIFLALQCQKSFEDEGWNNDSGPPMTTLDLDGQKHDFQREILAQQCQEQQSSPDGEPITELWRQLRRHFGPRGSQRHGEDWTSRRYTQALRAGANIPRHGYSGLMVKSLNLHKPAFLPTFLCLLMKYSICAG